MKLKALLICDDVRVEIGGTLTLVGVYNDRLVATAGDGPILLPRLTFLAVISELTGVERIGFRQHIRRVGEPEQELLPLSYEAHDPQMAEHNFVFGQAPMAFPGPGDYETVVEVDSRGQRLTFTYRFRVSRANQGVLA